MKEGNKVSELSEARIEEIIKQHTHAYPGKAPIMQTDWRKAMRQAVNEQAELIRISYRAMLDEALNSGDGAYRP